MDWDRVLHGFQSLKGVYIIHDYLKMLPSYFITDS